MANGALFYAWAIIIIMFSILVQPQHKGAHERICATTSLLFRNALPLSCDSFDIIDDHQRVK